MTKASPSTELLTISGNVVNDINLDCLPKFTEPKLGQFLVKSTAANGQIAYGMSNEAGKYQVLAKSGEYQLKVVPPNELWESCDTSVTVPANITSGSVYRNIAVQPAALCPRLQVEVGTPLLRRCFENRMTVTYQNTGTIPAQNAKIQLVLDPFLELLQSSLPPTAQMGDTLVYELGTLAVNFSSTFTVDVRVSCDAEIGQMHCTEAADIPGHAMHCLAGRGFAYSGHLFGRFGVAANYQFWRGRYVCSTKMAGFARYLDEFRLAFGGGRQFLLARRRRFFHKNSLAKCPVFAFQSATRT